MSRLEFDIPKLMKENPILKHLEVALIDGNSFTVTSTGCNNNSSAGVSCGVTTTIESSERILVPSLAGFNIIRSVADAGRVYAGKHPRAIKYTPQEQIVMSYMAQQVQNLTLLARKGFVYDGGRDVLGNEFYIELTNPANRDDTLEFGVGVNLFDAMFNLNERLQSRRVDIGNLKDYLVKKTA